MRRLVTTLPRLAKVMRPFFVYVEALPNPHNPNGSRLAIYIDFALKEDAQDTYNELKAELSLEEIE